jgi:hypothetical protein
VSTVAARVRVPDATDDRQQKERRFVRSDDPNPSAEANAALTEELQQAIGAEHVSMPADAPDPAAAERSARPSRARPPASSPPATPARRAMTAFPGKAAAGATAP